MMPASIDFQPTALFSETAGVRLLISGRKGGTHVGASLERAAATLGIPSLLIDQEDAYDGPWLRQKFLWRFLGRRPASLRRHAKHLLSEANRFQPTHLLATGSAPITSDVLHSLKRIGIRLLIFLTDDPWNPIHYGTWFIRSLREYDHVFTPRKANLAQITNLGLNASVLPFGYDPKHFFAETLSASTSTCVASDVLLVGGADRDRLPFAEALIDAGLSVGLYGGYWDRYPKTRGVTRGLADADQIRRATVAAKVCLCWVRRANRDGHVMRSYEIPACGGVPLMEDTEDHRELFRMSVPFFLTPFEAVVETRKLVASPELRTFVKMRSKAEFLKGSHQYSDRLLTMLQLDNQCAAGMR